MKQIICLVGLVAGLGFSASAQVTVSSLDQDLSRAKFATAKSTSDQQKVSAVGLPFFDDFASYEGLPNSQWWLTKGGVFINNRFGKDPISKNVATLDGLKDDGTEYLIPGTGSFAAGSRDTLTSTTILLNAFGPQDSVYLSFYWQAAGNSLDPPENRPTHFLRLEFKDNTGAWNQIWTQQGLDIRTAFALKMQPIRDSKYFHADFQFRFLTSGRKGMQDIWNIDYVLLDRLRSRSDSSRNDVAVSRPVRSLLKRYTAMPYDQFFANPAQELSDSVYTTVNNLNKQTPAPIEKKGDLRNLVSNQTSRYLDLTEIVPQGKSQFLINGTPNQTVIINRNAFISIENKMFIDYLELNPATRFNDTISRVTELHDYFAYDDGSPETGYSLARTGIRFGAFRYVLNQPDKVRSVRFYLTSVNTPGTAVTLRIWNDNNGMPDGNGKHVQTYFVPATLPATGWVEVMLDSAVSVSGTFYAGWGLSASVQQFFNLGYDLNESANQYFLYRDQSTLGNWATYTFPGATKGAVMFRPVLERSHIMALPETPVTNINHIYPNPSTGTVYLSADWQNVTVYNLFGSSVALFQNQLAGQPLQLGHLAKGIYLVRMQNGTNVIIKKLLLN